MFVLRLILIYLSSLSSIELVLMIKVVQKLQLGSMVRQDCVRKS